MGRLLELDERLLSMLVRYTVEMNGIKEKEVILLSPVLIP